MLKLFGCSVVGDDQRLVQIPGQPSGRHPELLLPGQIWQPSVLSTAALGRLTQFVWDLVWRWHSG